MRSDESNCNLLVETLLRVEGLNRKSVWRIAEYFRSWENFQKFRPERLAQIFPYLSEKALAGLSRILTLPKDPDASSNFVSFLDNRYPPKLRHLSDPPCGLFFRGSWEIFQQARPWVAVVGTRQASRYALEVCARLIGQMKAFDPVIVSGLALGVDGMAHRASLTYALKTVSVLGSNLQSIYPAVHRDLARQIEKDGLLLSECLPDAPLERWHFPQRNRVIAALSDAVVVVEAPEKSGALLTADFALDLGRGVYVVPGPIEDDRNRGGHRLIQEGAQLLLDGRDIFVDLGLAKPLAKMGAKASGGSTPSEAKPELLSPIELGAEERNLLEVMGFGPSHIDKIADMSDLPNPQVAGLLMQLSLKGLVEELPGQFFDLKALGREWLSKAQSKQ